MSTPVAASHAALPGPIRRALDLAWESFSAGSLGIGAVAYRGDGTELAAGRKWGVDHDQVYV